MTTLNPIRPGFRSITPYLCVDGAAKLIEFWKRAFAAEEVFRANRPDGTVHHAEVRFGDSMIELGDADAQYRRGPVAIHLYLPEVDAAYQRAVEAGAVSKKAPADTDYQDREAFVEDPCGNHWYIATHKGAQPIPDGLHTVTPFLSVDGAARMIDFLKRAFAAEEECRNASPEGVVHHAKIRIGDSVIEMSDSHAEFQPMPVALHIYVPDTDATYKRALAAGATSMTEPADQSYGDRSAGVKDPFGNQWFIATHLGVQ